MHDVAAEVMYLGGGRVVFWLEDNPGLRNSLEPVVLYVRLVCFFLLCFYKKIEMAENILTFVICPPKA